MNSWAGLWVAVIVLNCKFTDANIHVKDVSFQKSSQEISINYTISNKSKHIIWACNFVDEKIPLKASITLCKNNKNIIIDIISFNVPDDIYLEEAIYGQYVKILPDIDFKFKLRLKLPLKNRTPLTDIDSSINIDDTFMAKEILLRIGIISEDIGKKSGSYHELISNEEKVSISCFSDTVENEHILEYLIKDVDVPCVFTP